jgi:hypothetical protein
MIPSHAATMRRREERRLLLLYHGAGDAGAREELVHRFLPLARQLARRYTGDEREILRLRFLPHTTPPTGSRPQGRHLTHDS